MAQPQVIKFAFFASLTMFLIILVYILTRMCKGYFKLVKIITGWNKQGVTFLSADSKQFTGSDETIGEKIKVFCGGSDDQPEKSDPILAVNTGDNVVEQTLKKTLKQTPTQIQNSCDFGCEWTDYVKPGNIVTHSPV